jgi:GGDEF domain-containing protein
MRREELFGRLGGDEFGVLSPEVEADGARVLAERLRAVIADSPLTTESVEASRKSPTFSDVGQRPPETMAEAISKGPLSVTCSFGVAELTPDMENTDAFYAAADEALYASKNSGRNCVTVFGHPSDPES